MKKVQFLFFVFIAALFSCSSRQEKQTEKITSFISGTYVREFAGEYAAGNDTLLITQPYEDKNFYTIRHRSSYQKIREKKLQLIEYKSENWTAIFNEQTNVLLEQKKGKQIFFSPEKNELILGESHFKKID